MHGLSQIIKSVILSVISVKSVVNKFMEINILIINAKKSAKYSSGFCLEYPYESFNYTIVALPH